ncbi:hypothetical protein M8C21_010497 [Ambrosia artemisiifolia]|uniref:Uncharacterized protein n=1 Tax=Ambrosia artemisiifolia TaxID=4212 RepID=A0AAD5BKT0_AMBAR|nr:hypothetical protein M8C21_010497 [Ambrosia artemisiifolia]
MKEVTNATKRTPAINNKKDPKTTPLFAAKQPLLFEEPDTGNSSHTEIKHPRKQH